MAEDSANNEKPDEKNDKTNFQMPTYPYKTCTEYGAAVNQWLWQCYNLQCIAYTFPYYAALAATNANSVTTAGTSDFNRNLVNAFTPNQNFVPNQTGPFVRTTVDRSQGHDYVIPTLWKRFTAEVIDFVLLLILKVLITYIAVDFFDLISKTTVVMLCWDLQFSEESEPLKAWGTKPQATVSSAICYEIFENLDKYDFSLLKDDNKVDYQKAMEVTSEIIALEIIHRFVVCIFEALCIHKGIASIGGATPGKNIMKIKVVSCYSVTPLDINRVRVYPAGDLGFGWALLRAFIKNFSLAFIFPICFTMFFFQHNRTAYDIICNSIVVEEPRPQRPHQH